MLELIALVTADTMLSSAIDCLDRAVEGVGNRRDPREDLPTPVLRSDVLSMDDLLVSQKMENIKATAEDIRRVVNTYFAPTNRSVGTYTRRAGAASDGVTAPMLRLHWSPDSANLVVRIALEAFGLLYDDHRLDRSRRLLRRHGELVVEPHLHRHLQRRLQRRRKVQAQLTDWSMFWRCYSLSSAC